MKTNTKAEPAPAQVAQHTIPPEIIATIQRVLNNAGDSLRNLNEGQSADCFEAARRLNLIADERAELIQALQACEQIIDENSIPEDRGTAAYRARAKARAAIAKATKAQGGQP